MWDLASTNLTSPAVLAFALGLVAALGRASLRLPAAVSTFISAYLLLAIGLKGGVALSESQPSELVMPAVITVVLGVVTAIASLTVLRRFGRFSVADSAGIAAHYGSVSVVTFTAATAFARAQGAEPEGFLPALVALLEVPGIVVALVCAQWLSRTGDASGALREVLTGKSILLLGGGLFIGAVSGPQGYAPVEPLFTGLFPGFLVLFLLDLGALAGEKLADVRKAGSFLIGFALGAPVVFGVLGAVAGTAAGLSPAGAAVMAAMAASASYIAAPAAVQLGLPAANPALSLTASLGITFPFNLIIGIPLYHRLAEMLAGGGS